MAPPGVCDAVFLSNIFDHLFGVAMNRLFTVRPDPEFVDAVDPPACRRRQPVVEIAGQCDAQVVVVDAQQVSSGVEAGSSRLVPRPTAVRMHADASVGDVRTPGARAPLLRRQVYVKHRIAATSSSPPPPQPFYGPFFQDHPRVSQCQKRTSGLYGARED